VVTEVLGELAFMLTDEQPPEQWPGTTWLQGEIAYRGPVSGRLRCWCTRELAARLAANLLGIEAQQDEAQIRAPDAVREFMNVLCGQLITRWYGRQMVLNLAIPTVRECFQSPPIHPQASDACQLSVEGEPLLCLHEQE